MGFEPHAAQSDFIQAGPRSWPRSRGTGSARAPPDGLRAPGSPARRGSPPAAPGVQALRGADAGLDSRPDRGQDRRQFRPAFQKWCPPSEFLGGNWGKAFKGDTNLLRFKCGSTIQFKTYKQDPSTLGGAGLCTSSAMTSRLPQAPGGVHVAPRGPRRLRDVRDDAAGHEHGLRRREIYKKRESPDITVVSGRCTTTRPEQGDGRRAIGVDVRHLRRAREFGEFVDIGGLIYPEFERCVDGSRGPRVRPSWDIVVGIDPGIRNAGIVFVGFDRDNTAYVFSALLLQDSTPKDYARRSARSSRAGASEERAHVRRGPRARGPAGQTNAETVMSALLQERHLLQPGPERRADGHRAATDRMAHSRFWVSPDPRSARSS
jgi:hypothetical protein